MATPIRCFNWILPRLARLQAGSLLMRRSSVKWKACPTVDLVSGEPLSPGSPAPRCCRSCKYRRDLRRRLFVAHRLNQRDLLGAVVQQLAHGLAELEQLAAVAAVPEGVPVPRPCPPADTPAVHSAAPTSLDRRRAARAAAAGPCSAARAPVHGPGLPVHGVDPRFCAVPH